MHYDYQKRKPVIKVTECYIKNRGAKATIFFRTLNLILWQNVFLPIDYFCTLVGQPDNWQVPWKPSSFCLGRYDQKQKLAEDFDESTTHLHAPDNVLNDSHPSKW